MAEREAIGLIETISIAVGVRITDEMAKVAPVEILEATAARERKRSKKSGFSNSLRNRSVSRPSVMGSS